MEDPKSGPLIRNYIPLTSGNGVPTLEELRQNVEWMHAHKPLPPYEIESSESRRDIV